METEKELQDRLYEQAKTLLEQKTSMEEIEKQLAKQTADPSLRALLMDRLKKEQNEAVTKNGLAKLVAGAFLLLTGFVVTCINFHADQSFLVIMYGSSSLGIVLVFWGLYETLG